MESVHLQLSKELLARLDEARGDVARNPWIRRAIEQRLRTGNIAKAFDVPARYLDDDPEGSNNGS